MGKSLRKVKPNLGFFDLRVINRDVSVLREEVADERDGRRLARVAGVSLEGKAKDGNVLYRKRSKMTNLDWKG